MIYYANSHVAKAKNIVYHAILRARHATSSNDVSNSSSNDVSM